MIAVVIATIVTEGAASETIPLAGAEMGSEGSAEGAVEGASNSLGAVIRSGMPDDLGSFSSAGAKFSAASSIVGNGAGLAAKAANGEHISAWQAIRGMLIEPVIAAASGGIGGAVAGMGLEAADGALRVFGWAAIGAAAGSLADSVANTAISGRLGTHAAWESIGIQMAVAVGEGVIMAPFFMRVRVRGDVPLRQRVRMGLSRLPIEYWEAVSEGLWVSSGTTDRSVLWAVPAEETTPLAAGMSSDWALDTGPLENQRASASSSGSGLGSGSRANSSSKTASPKSSEGYSDDYY
jgi:hypothetical protein